MQTYNLPVPYVFIIQDTASEAEPQESRTKEHSKPSKKTFSSGSWSLQLQKGSTDVSNKKRMDTDKEPKPHPAASSLQQKSKEKAAREITKYPQQEMEEKTKVDDRMNIDRDRSDDVDKKSKTVKNSDDNDAVIGKPELTNDCDNSDNSDEKPKSLSDGDNSDSDNEKPRSVENCDNTNSIDKKSSEDCDDAEEETKTEDEDPLNVDLYEKLCVENNVDEAEIIKWDKYVVGDDLQRACKWLSCSEKQF